MSNTELSIVILEEAEAEAIEAFDSYREKAGEEIAHGFRAAMRSTIARVRVRPETYPKFEGDVRRCLFKRYPYAVLYEVTEAAIIVVAIMHLRRLPGYWTGRRQSE